MLNIDVFPIAYFISLKRCRKTALHLFQMLNTDVFQIANSIPLKQKKSITENSTYLVLVLYKFS